jgi:Ala-tRNA(Pro) deacylase
MPATPEQLFAFLDRLGIAHETVTHPPIFTVEDGRAWHDKIPGLHCKNLFIKDRKGKIWLVTMPAGKRADISGIEKRVGGARFSFGKPELLMEVLGVTPGSVTPFGLINDAERRVTVILDDELAASESLNIHPLHNAASTVVQTADLIRFIKALGYEPLIVPCGENER